MTQRTLITVHIIKQLLTFILINIRIYRSKINDIYLGFGLGKYHISWKDRSLYILTSTKVNNCIILALNYQFICAITSRIFQNTWQENKLSWLKRTTFVYVLISDGWNRFFSSPCQRQCVLLPSLGVHRPRLLTFHILIFSSETLKPLSQMNWNLVGSFNGRSAIKIAYFIPIR